MSKRDSGVAIVSGPPRGLGRDYAKRLAESGARVTVADLERLGIALFTPEWR